MGHWTIRVHAGSQTAELGATDLIIGRSVYCTLVVEDSSLSRVHAALRRVEDGCELADLGSTNGTFVNGKKIGAVPVRVRPGDQIEVGGIALSLERVPLKRGALEQTRGSHPVGRLNIESPPPENTAVIRKPKKNR